jgi:hypothetical protein
MDNHQRVVQLALSFEAVIFGGYIRDVLICKEDKFNDIDILWYNTIQNSMESFMTVLFCEPWVKTHEITEYKNSKYGENKRLVKININNELNIDIVVYHGTYTAWLNERDCDFSCNLFYKTRTNNMAIKYIPEAFLYCPDAFTHIYDLTKDKKFVSIGDQYGFRYWKRMSRRGLNLVENGWVLQGKLMSNKQRQTIGPGVPCIMKIIRTMNNIMDEGALGVIAPKINDVCKDKIRRKLFDYDSESEIESVNSCPGLIEDPE